MSKHIENDKNERNIEAKNKTEPAYLQDNYPYKAIGEPLSVDSEFKANTIYEIRCTDCEMCIRTLSCNLKNTYRRIEKNGCVVCGCKDLIIKEVSH